MTEYLASRELYRLVRRELDPLFRSLGFLRTPRSSWASWSCRIDDRWLTVWFQSSPRNGAVPGAAFEFTVEYQLAQVPSPGLGYRMRLFNLLSDTQRDELRARQNVVIGRLLPPSDPSLGTGDSRMADFVLSQFAPVESPYIQRQDIWFKQDGDAAVLMWTSWLKELIPSTIDLFLATAGRSIAWAVSSEQRNIHDEQSGQD